MSFVNEHVCRIVAPSEFVALRRDRTKTPNEIIGIRADGRREVCEYRYMVGRWSMERARGHTRKAGGEFVQACVEQRRGNDTPERRPLVAQSWRADAADGDSPAKLVGYAAIFDSLSEDLGGFRERIEPGAFAKSLKRGDDVVAEIEHQGGLSTLGRRSSGTLDLQEDDRGLLAEIVTPDTSAGRDVAELVGRGDLRQMSFGFRTVTDEWNMVDGEEIRTLKEVDLFDVSVVAMPAYSDTTVALRSIDRWHTARRLGSDEIRSKWKARHLTAAKKSFKL